MKKSILYTPLFRRCSISSRAVSSKTVPVIQRACNKEYDKKNVVYIAYIGVYERKHTFKFGKSTNIVSREVNSHQKQFESFDMLYIHETNMKDQVELRFKRLVKELGLHTNLMIKEKKQTELFQLEDYNAISAINDMMKGIIANMSPMENEHHDQIELEKLRIRRLELEYKVMQCKLVSQLLFHRQKQGGQS